jgi:hypothetical protein
MALALQVKISGVVNASVTKVLVNGVNAPISASREYSATVLASVGTVGITTILSDGSESVRTIQLTSVSGVPG